MSLKLVVPVNVDSAKDDFLANLLSLKYDSPLKLQLMKLVFSPKNEKEKVVSFLNFALLKIDSPENNTTPKFACLENTACEKSEIFENCARLNTVYSLKSVSEKSASSLKTVIPKVDFWKN